MIFKIKIGRRTQKSAADDPKILAGCFFNPQNVYFEVCMVRAKVVCFMNYANVYVVLLELEETKQINLCNDLYIEYSMTSF